MFHNPNWTAARGTENWRDETVLRATAWLRSFVSAKEMDRRLEIAREYLLAARGQWELGVMPPLYDPVDTIAWYIPQAETFAIDRQLWVPGETARIVPFLARIGEELDRVRGIGGVEIRAERLM